MSDQLLTKLQVHRQDEKDVRDVLTLLKDLELAEDEAPGVIGLWYVAARCAADWGLQHDVERNLDRAEALMPGYALSDDEEGRVREGLARLRAALADAPKSVALATARQGRRAPSLVPPRRGTGRGDLGRPARAGLPRAASRTPARQRIAPARVTCVCYRTERVGA